MRDRIECALHRLVPQRKKALVAFVTAGFPTLRMSERIVHVLEQSGVDMIELGMPFSDPIADGPVIQESSAMALRRGMNVRRFLGLVQRVRRRTDIPLIMMTYYNPLLQYGIARFCRAAAAAGLDGVIVPDMPLEESAELRKETKRCGLALIPLISPLTDIARSRRIAARADGFVYYVSLAGVTGARRTLPAEITAHVRRLKAALALPVFVGFGISTPAQVRMIAAVADGVIVGSAFIQQLKQSGKRGDWSLRMRQYALSLSRMTQSA